MYVTKKRSEVIWFVAPTAIIFLLLMIRFPIFTKEEKGDKFVNATLTIFPSIDMINIDIIAIYYRLSPIFIIYVLVFCSFFYFLFDNFRLTRK